MFNGAGGRQKQPSAFHDRNSTMKYRFPLALGAAAAAGFVAMPAQAHDHAKSSQQRGCQAVTKAQVEAQFGRFNQAWATRNPDTVTKLFSRGAVLLPTVSNTPRTDHAGIRDYFVSFLKAQPVGKIDSSNVRLGCNTASRTGTWTVSLTDPTTRQARDVKARYSFIYVYENGEWKIDHLHSSMMPEQTTQTATSAK
jgi:uncharacterized protein (TIGR02246 family)